MAEYYYDTAGPPSPDFDSETFVGPPTPGSQEEEEWVEDFNENRENGNATFIIESEIELSPLEDGSYYSPIGDDIENADGDAALRESMENEADDPAADGLEYGFDEFFQANDRGPEAFAAWLAEAELYHARNPRARFQPRSSEAANTDNVSSVLDDRMYKRVVDGWNQKIASSSEDISGLTPFCELYAIFDDNDLIYQEEGNRYTNIATRLYNVKFNGAEGNKPALPEGISEVCKIAKIAGENASQISSDSIMIDNEGQYSPYSSFKGLPGISDLAVSRGSAAAQSVKYDLTLTMPNPEIINEKFEYSKLMLMNSAFLVIYGWNIRDSKFDVDHYPPLISKDSQINHIPIGNGIGGFWSSAVISLYNFEFNFDTVGHLVGKLRFLNNSSIFLGSIQVEAVGNTMVDSLTKPSESVLSRVNNNQNFIWENGVPWSTNAANEAMALNSNTTAARTFALRDYFENENTIWNEAHQRHIGDAYYTEEDAELLRFNIFNLKEIGETFLINYRKKFLNKLWRGKREGTLNDNELKVIEELETSGMNDLGKDRTWRTGLWTSSEQVWENGRSYKGGDEEDKIIDSYYDQVINRAWNNFFLLRFQGTNNTANLREDANPNVLDITEAGGGLSSGVSRGVNIPMKLLPTDDSFFNIPAGSTFDDFLSFASSVTIQTREMDAAIDRGDAQDTRKLVVGFVERDYGRGELIPELFRIEFESAPSSIAENAFIKNMPPFGVDLQRRTMNAFKNETNLNYGNFWGPRSIFQPDVKEIINTTSVVSVPFPMSVQDAAALSIEERTYSEIMRDAPQEIIISFELLNPIPNTAGDDIPDTLYSIQFHNTSVLTSLSSISDTIKELVDDLLENSPFDPSVGITINADSDFAFRDNMRESFWPVNDLPAHRFVQWRIAILKNGYMVRQFKNFISDQTFSDFGEPTLVGVDSDGLVSGLPFFTDLLPSDMLEEIGKANDEANKTKWESETKTWLQVISEQRGTFQARQDAAYEIWQGDLTEDMKAHAERQFRAAERLTNNYNILIGLEQSIAAAVEGTQALVKEDMNQADEDEVSIQDGVGATTHTIFRQPVYLFLGSVLEALRITTNDKVKFYYSKIPLRKEGEPFHISIPETTGNSIEASYDAQIADLTRQMSLLHAVPSGTETQTIDMFPVEPTDAAAEDLRQKQQIWDDGLVRYIRGRGQDFLSLGYNDRGTGLIDFYNREGSDTREIRAGSNDDMIKVGEISKLKPEGVYRSYVSRGGHHHFIRPRSPNYYWTFGHAFMAVDDLSKSINTITQEVNDDNTRGYADSPDGINIRAPWIYRIGEADNHWDGPNGLYRTGVSTDYGWQKYGMGNEGWKNEYAGFMRLWRPEDLNRAIFALYKNINFYTRKPVGDGPAGLAGGQAGFPSFSTDSFGQGNLATRPRPNQDPDLYRVNRPPMPDWGLQEAFSETAHHYYTPSDAAGSYTPELVGNKEQVVKQLTGWLNWFPFTIGDTEFNGDKFPSLGSSKHRNLGFYALGEVEQKTNPNEIQEVIVDGRLSTAQAEAAKQGWYKIEWGEPGEQPDPFWVKGFVVQDYVFMEGPRPTTFMPSPLLNESVDEAQDRYEEIRSLQNRIDDLKIKRAASNLKAQFRNLEIRTTYEIPVYIDTIRHFLESEPNAPLHNLLKKVLGAVKETVPAIQLSMRPTPSDPTYIDVFPSNVNYDGIIQEVFTEIDVNRRAGEGVVMGGDEMNILTTRSNINYGNLVTSEKVIVCQFGTQ